MTYREVTLDIGFDIYSKGKYDSDPIFYDRVSEEIVKVYYYSHDDKSIYYHAYEEVYLDEDISIEHILEIEFHKRFVSKEGLRDIKLKEILE